MGLLLQITTTAVDTVQQALQQPQVQTTVQNTVQNAMAATQAPQGLTLWDLTVKGGIIMIPIAILLLLAIYIFFERLFVIIKASKDESVFMNSIKDAIMKGEIDSAVKLCKVTQTPVARMLEKGINRLGRPLEDIHQAIQNVAQLEVYELESNLNTLATTAGAAPMLGFLGTVVGMVQAFYDMTLVGAGNINIVTLSNGIYTAMITTVAGLVVGIPAYFAYNYLTARVGKVVNMLQGRAVEFLDILNEPAK